MIKVDRVQQEIWPKLWYRLDNLEHQWDFLLLQQCKLRHISLAEYIPKGILGKECQLKRILKVRKWELSSSRKMCEYAFKVSSLQEYLITGICVRISLLLGSIWWCSLIAQFRLVGSIITREITQCVGSVTGVIMPNFSVRVSSLFNRSQKVTWTFQHPLMISDNVIIFLQSTYS